LIQWGNISLVRMHNPVHEPGDALSASAPLKVES